LSEDLLNPELAEVILWISESPERIKQAIRIFVEDGPTYYGTKYFYTQDGDIQNSGDDEGYFQNKAGLVIRFKVSDIKPLIQIFFMNKRKVYIVG
jgi:hypothetical protein